MYRSLNISFDMWLSFCYMHMCSFSLLSLVQRSFSALPYTFEYYLILATMVAYQNFNLYSFILDAQK